MLNAVGSLRLGIVADEAAESESVEVHVSFSCSAVLGHPEASGHRSQGKESLIWGDQHGGARTGTAPQAKQRRRSPPGAGIRPEAVPRTEGQIRKQQSRRPIDQSME